MNVCVVALGKIGLPLAVQFARSGQSVIGVDIDPAVVDSANRGEAPFPGETNLDDFLAEVCREGMFRATTDTEAAVRDSDVVVVVVPLIVDGAGRPDFAALDAATQAIGRGLQAGTLVVYETTLPVGTTRQRFTPALESASGLTSGDDFFVAFSPERVFAGRIFADLARYPKLVGGIDPSSTRRAVEFYERVLAFDARPDLVRPNGVWDLGSAEAAELAKLAETTYRDINIAFANELARHADQIGVDVFTVIEASNSQPFSHIHLPGVAVGGHCIPVYPRLYLAGDPDAELPAASRRVNDSMPAYAVQLLSDAAGDLNGKTIAVLGAAYRGGVRETAFSGVFPLVRALLEAGSYPVVHDPLFGDSELRTMGLAPYHLGDACDAAIIQTNHLEYRGLRSKDLGGARIVVDGRNHLDPDTDLSVITLGRAGVGRDGISRK